VTTNLAETHLFACETVPGFMKWPAAKPIRQRRDVRDLLGMTPFSNSGGLDGGVIWVTAVISPGV
jgi:hypothetical protein